MVYIDSGSKREIKDIALTKNVCYLVAQICDVYGRKLVKDANKEVIKELGEKGVVGYLLLMAVLIIFTE